MARVSTRTLLRSGGITRHGLTAGQAIALVALIDHTDREGLAFPSQDTLALETGLSRLGVRNAVRALCEKGLVEVIEPGGPRRSARYRVTVRAQLRATE